MQRIQVTPKIDYPLTVAIGLMLLLSIFVLHAIAPTLFPLYYLYLLLGILVFFVFLQIDFEIISLFSKHLYIISIVLLILPLVIGQVTRGAVRWIPIGALTIQPAEIVRPLLLIFFANYLTTREIDGKRFVNALLLLAVPTILILIQPSLGVAFLTAVGFLGIIFASAFKKKYIFWAVIFVFMLLPIIWQILAPYQKLRILTFVEPSRDPYGAGYNSIQSMISVGSGKLFGRGLGRGVQTQLSFLPERHTDFIFASIAEEMGLIGAGLVLLGAFFILARIVTYIDKAQNPMARAFISGLFLTLFAQSLIHIGMNLGLLPITGVPFPLLSAGGSSLIATMASLGIALGARRKI